MTISSIMQGAKHWLHGTLHVGVLAGRGLPSHTALSGKCLPYALDSCLRGTSRVACSLRPAQAYVAVELGVTRR